VFVRRAPAASVAIWRDSTRRSRRITSIIRLDAIA
jgi:hypothetical protein